MAKRVLCALTGILLISGQATAGNMLFVLDASGSMWGKIDGQFKIDVAKSTLSDLVGQLPDGSKFGVMVYGHRYDKDSPDSCNDIELFSAVGQSEPDSVRAWLKELNPKGQTPMAQSLLRSGDAFVGLEEQPNNVVLISDGKETCEGDPCAVAESLARAGTNVRIHVVGFDVGAEERDQLECIARMGNGEYFSADSTDGFTKAVSEAVLVAQAEPEPTPEPEPATERVFFDDFDGSELAPHWTVQNENADGYLVEDGQLLIFSGKTTGFQQEGMDNIVTLTEFPDADDWDAIVRFKGEFRTGRDQVWFGLYKDNQNFLSAELSWYLRPGSDYDYFTLRLLKNTNGEMTETRTDLHTSNLGDAAWDSFLDAVESGVSSLVLSKRGRSYSASYSNDSLKEADGTVKSWSTDSLTSLRVPGDLAFSVSKWGDAGGEVLSFVDSIEIVKFSE